MDYLTHILADFRAHFWLYLSMPLISGIVGYVTNVVAVKMMFYPLNFWGIPPLLGWQGIIPRRAGKMASISVDVITENLVSPEEMFSRLDANRIADELEEPLNRIVGPLTDKIMQKHAPLIWASTPETIKQRVYDKVKAEAPDTVNEMLDQVRNNMDRMFDISEMVITSLVRDKNLLNRMFKEAADPEFRFIERSGFFFGFLFGIAQMLLWVFYKGAWILPLAGLLVGYFTNWIALKMIFEPQQPKKIAGYTFHGLFHKRQDEVARDYGTLVSKELITPANIFEALLKGPYSDKLFAFIQRRVGEVLDETTSLAKPFMALTMGSRTYNDIKSDIVDSVVAELPETMHSIVEYAEDAMDLKQTIITRLAALPSDRFEGMLRPAFEEDEWMLIAVGAALGMAVGFFQLFVMFADQLATL